MGQNRIENLKNVALVLLFLSTMLLLYFFWENPNLDSFRLSSIIADEEDPAIALDSSAVTRPREAAVHFGNGVYTLLPHDRYGAFEQTVAALAGTGADENLAVEEITAEQYRQVMDFRSLRFEFAYDIPFQAFLNKYQILRTQSLEAIETLTILSYSVGSPESLFIYDGKNKRHYRLVAREELPPLAQLIDRAETDSHTVYYTLGALVGTRNPTVVPLALEAGIGPLAFTGEFTEDRDDEVRAYAQTFFGESFDFVRRIEETKGAVIYMYGYGEKILTVNADGSSEYKEKEGLGGTQPGYFGSLDLALQFIASHGGFAPEGSAALTPYVEKAVPLERERRRGFRFVFGAEINGTRIRLQERDWIVVEVIGDQVVFYSRSAMAIDPEDAAIAMTQQPREAYSAINMLAQNNQRILTSLLSQGILVEGETEEALFEAMSDHISMVEKGYAEQSERDGSRTLVPAWSVKAGDAVLHFGLYDAEPLETAAER